jgi:adenosylmethionine-8-amino-7-oxononanoate aminotransferase
MSEAGAIHKHVIHRKSHDLPIITRAEGIYLYDAEGQRYFDGVSGSAAVTNLGYGNPEILKALQSQSDRLTYASPHVFTNERLLELGQAVCDRAPEGMRGQCRVWFTGSGTEGVEDALRLARQYHLARGNGSKHLVLGRWGSFHGNSIAVAGVHGLSARRRHFLPMFVSQPHLPPAYCYRCEFGLEVETCGLRCAEAFEKELNRLGAENVAGLIAEPVVGAALGGVPAPPGYFEVIRSICDRYDVLLIADEVMTGWGRLGEWFGLDTYGVCPDVAVLAKGFGAGYTSISAVVARAEIWDAVQEDGGFVAGHTHNQNPLSCAVALAVISEIEKNDLLAHVRETEGYLAGRLQELAQHDIVGDVRGRGSMYGIEFVQDRETKKPFDPIRQVSLCYQQEALSRGLIQYACSGSVDGVAGDMVLITPPLILTRDQIDEMASLMDESIVATQRSLKG